MAKAKGQATNGFSGTVTNTSLHDVTQLLCIGRNTCTMRVRCADRKGDISFRDGEIVHAATDDLKGEEAFYAILSWELGDFVCEKGISEEQTIQESWDFLLMESMRRLDSPYDS